MNIQRNCKCGKEHVFEAEVILGEGVLQEIPTVLKKYNAKKVFLIADRNTYKAAGETVEHIIKKGEIACSSYVFQKDVLEPDETNVGLAIMY